MVLIIFRICWEVGTLKCWKVGRLKCWKVAELKSWKVAELVVISHQKNLSPFTFHLTTHRSQLTTHHQIVDTH